MEKYLVTYDYKVMNGRFISIKTKTEVLTVEELSSLTKNNDFYDNYMKIVFCEKLE